jgi:hypothetical protein
MFGLNKTVVGSFVLLALASLTGCAGLETSKFSYSQNAKINEANKSPDCYDASVLLGKNVVKSKDIAKKVLVGIDSTISVDKADEIKAERNRHVGLFVGSGGEELSVKLKEVTAENTFITVTTKTGFVGGAGQKPWSCQIADEIVKMAAK